MQIWTSLEEDLNVQKLQEDVKKNLQQLDESRVVVKTFPISQKFTKINEAKVPQKRIKELKKEEQELIDRTQPQQDNTLQISQRVDGNLQELRQNDEAMLQKVIEHVTKTILEEARNVEKQMIEVLQHFNHAYNRIVENIKGTTTK